jgi:dolichol-phosphate mannosyltransferase
MKNNFLLSVIIPVYNESGNIQALLSRLMPTVSKYTYEVVFVNDGPTDTHLS